MPSSKLVAFALVCLSIHVLLADETPDFGPRRLLATRTMLSDLAANEGVLTGLTASHQAAIVAQRQKEINRLPTEAVASITTNDANSRHLLAVKSAQGFGCRGPWRSDEYECSNYCRSIGYRNGYCNAYTGWMRCDCH